MKPPRCCCSIRRPAAGCCWLCRGRLAGFKARAAELGQPVWEIGEVVGGHRTSNGYGAKENAINAELYFAPVTRLWPGWYGSRIQPLAVAAGLLVLQAGGNAADAAVATAAALNVTEPTSTGLGGDAFALFYDAESQHGQRAEGSGRSPRALTLERLRREGLGQALPPFHPYTVTVPGAAGAWCDLVRALAPAAEHQPWPRPIRLAEEGFPVAPVTAYYWQRGVRAPVDPRRKRAGADH